MEQLTFLGFLPVRLDSGGGGGGGRRRRGGWRPPSLSPLYRATEPLADAAVLLDKNGIPAAAAHCAPALIKIKRLLGRTRSDEISFSLGLKIVQDNYNANAKAAKGRI